MSDREVLFDMATREGRISLFVDYDTGTWRLFVPSTTMDFSTAELAEFVTRVNAAFTSLALMKTPEERKAEMNAADAAVD